MAAEAPQAVEEAQMTAYRDTLIDVLFVGGPLDGERKTVEIWREVIACAALPSVEPSYVSMDNAEPPAMHAEMKVIHYYRHEVTADGLTAPLVVFSTHLKPKTGWLLQCLFKGYRKPRSEDLEQ